MRRLIVLMAAILGFSVLGTAAAQGSGAAAPRLTAKDCVECHEVEAETRAYHANCASCHVNAQTHAKAERPRTVKVSMPETTQCQSCHVKDAKRMNFAFAEHDRAGVQCRDCHGNHTPKVASLPANLHKAGKTVAVCATCHQDVLARLNMPSHHPVREGALSCVSCHDPHAGRQTTLINKTELCQSCHQRVRGPHAFEHAPVVEDCGSCHVPHGSPNRRLLEVAQPMLCLQCHSLPNVRHGQTASNNPAVTAITSERISGAALRNCTACHAQIHGSSHDEHLRY